jgi:23S rRNA (uridine2552-2'-O)-methyltransferase
LSKSLNSKSWLHRHLTDPYVKKSVKAGYRSRAAYKLTELDQMVKLLKPGQTIVDLGAAPGGWSQVAVKAVGPKGHVVAIDILDMEPVHGVHLLKGDFTEDAGLAGVVEALGGRKVDLVLSDMAPNLTGIALTDQVRMFHLAELALEFCREFLKPNGDFVVKVFQGSGYIEFVKAMRELFKKVSVEKPGASRPESGELYLVGKGRKAV